MLGPGFPIYARGDSSVATRQPSLYAVPSTYVANARQAASQQSFLIAAVVAIGVIWFLGRRK